MTRNILRYNLRSDVITPGFIAFQALRWLPHRASKILPSFGAITMMPYNGCLHLVDCNFAGASKRVEDGDHLRGDKVHGNAAREKLESFCHCSRFIMVTRQAGRAV